MANRNAQPPNMGPPFKLIAGNDVGIHQEKTYCFLQNCFTLKIILIIQIVTTLLFVLVAYGGRLDEKTLIEAVMQVLTDRTMVQ